MIRSLILLFVITLFISCKHGDKIPDVSNIKVDITTQRFEKDFFDCDSAHIFDHLRDLKAKYPAFTDIYLSQIVGLEPGMNADSINRYLGGFINSYGKKVYDTAEMMFRDFSSYEDEIKRSLQFVKYYFPDYKIPNTIVTYIGPVEGTGNIYSAEDGIIGVGLEHHLGKNFSLYQESFVQETYPDYVSAQFEPSYIDVNSMKNILNDIYPEKETDDPLVNRMVENGKRLYALSKFLPYTDEYKLIGYTEKQLKDCYSNEAAVWNMFIQNDLLQSIDPDVIKDYIGDSPKTAQLGEGAPGNIGSFAGWQIVKKYMHKNDKVTLEQLLNISDDVIFQDAKYKP